MFNSTSKAVGYRPLNALGLLLCVSAMAFALIYLEGHLGLQPCPLCALARLVIMVQALLFLVAFFHNPQHLGQRLYAALLLLAALAGLAVSGRHIWLQSLPAEQVPACGPGLEYMLDSFPLAEVLTMVFSGSGECAEVVWRFAGLSIPQQTFVLFLGLAALSIRQLRRKGRRSYFS